ncbi:hypothetical protein B4110_0761 [Parageobacillus toebii]|uniref:Uncharacterized protein n=1 Tax=Parageobacillus toebii TaxID=153151 RepID=A0A150N6G4_9BACL|nr:hypothetical protein B4110_0761 [Parageobacillus toebii]
MIHHLRCSSSPLRYLSCPRKKDVCKKERDNFWKVFVALIK